MDDSRITCRATDRACGYTRKRGRLLSHFLCWKTLAMCGHICGQLVVLLFSSGWFTTGTTYCTSLSLFCLVEPFLSKSSPMQASRWMASSIFHLLILQQWDVTQLCHRRISRGDPAPNKTRQRTSACDGIQIAFLQRFFFAVLQVRC